MELLGKIQRRAIYYIAIRNHLGWRRKLPKSDWLVFTIANKEDEDQISVVTQKCLNNKVAYTCSAGELGGLGEQYFDEEIVWRAVQYESETKQDFDYNNTPVTTSHESIEEGFWFATSVAFTDGVDINKVVCIDMTKKKVKKHLLALTEAINKGWLPE